MTTVLDNDRCEYNGVEFDIYKSEVEIRPRYDQAKRTVVASVYKFTISGYVVADANNTVDDTITDLTKRLSKNGGKFEYLSKGMGKFIVNGAGPRIDTNWGPKPQIISMTPIGDDRAWSIKFVVEMEIPDCKNAKYKFQIAEFNQERIVSLDKHGFITITHRGHVEIPLTKLGVNTPGVFDTADAYLERIVPPLSIGFQRVQQDRTLSMDNRRLDFTFVDKIEYSPKPVLVSDHNIQHTLESSMKSGFVVWEGSLGGTIYVPIGVEKRVGYLAFLSLFDDRTNELNLVNANNNNNVNISALLAGNITNNNGAAGVQRLTLLTGIRLSDSVGQNSFSIQFRWRTIFRQNLFRLLNTGGIFDPWPDTNFASFRDSMNLSANRPRSAANVRFPAANDSVIDLCTPLVANPQSLDAQNQADWEPPAGAGQVAANRDRYTDDQRYRIPPDNSWLAYYSEIVYEEREGRYATNQPMGGTTRETDVFQNITDTGTTPSEGGTTATVSSDKDNNIHEVRSPLPHVRLRGYAVRIGHQIPVPRLVRVEGRTAYQNRIIRTRQSIVGRYLTIPIYRMTWDVEYVLENGPREQLPVPVNRLLGV